MWNSSQSNQQQNLRVRGIAILTMSFAMTSVDAAELKVTNTSSRTVNVAAMYRSTSEWGGGELSHQNVAEGFWSVNAGATRSISLRGQNIDILYLYVSGWNPHISDHDPLVLRKKELRWFGKPDLAKVVLRNHPINAYETYENGRRVQKNRPNEPFQVRSFLASNLHQGKGPYIFYSTKIKGAGPLTFQYKGGHVSRTSSNKLIEENSVITMKLPRHTPRKVLAEHYDQQRERTYFYQQSGGAHSTLRVYRPGSEIHNSRYLGSEERSGTTYFRYRVTFTDRFGPEWVIRATNEGRYEIWFPKGGDGSVRYSQDRGKSFVPESAVPMAGFARAKFR